MCNALFDFDDIRRFKDGSWVNDVQLSGMSKKLIIKELAYRLCCIADVINDTRSPELDWEKIHQLKCEKILGENLAYLEKENDDSVQEFKLMLSEVEDILEGKR